MGTWGSYGYLLGQFRRPSWIGVASDGTVLVTETEAERLQALESNGTGLWASHVVDPGGVTVSASGKIYVVENRAVLLSGGLVEFDMEGNQIAESLTLSALGCELVDERCLYVMYGHYIVVVDAMTRDVVGEWGIDRPVYAWGGGFGITADRQGYLYMTLASTTAHYFERWRPATVQTRETTWGRIKAGSRKSLPVP